MAGSTMRFRNPAGHAGLLDNLVALGRALADFVESRMALFASESKSALAHLLVLGACLVGAALLFGFGYIFLVASAIAGIARAMEISWVWLALMAAGLHFFLAIICLLLARSRMTKPMFESSALELKKDREWLKNLDKKNPSTS